MLQFFFGGIKAYHIPYTPCTMFYLCFCINGELRVHLFR